MWKILYPLCQNINVMGRIMSVFTQMLLIHIYFNAFAQKLRNINSSTLCSHYLLCIVECYRCESEKSSILIVKISWDKKENICNFQVFLF